MGWSNPQIGDAVRASLVQWRDLHVGLAEEFGNKIGGLGPRLCGNVYFYYSE